MPWLWRLLLILLAFAPPGVVLAQSLQPVPALGARVTDLASVLSAPQKQALEAKLAAFEAAHGSQVVVLAVRHQREEDYH